MDTLDSRSLRYVDCFGKKFPDPGTVRYRVSSAAGAGLPLDDDTFTIDIKKGTKSRDAGEQHNVTIRQDGKRLVADPSRIQIQAGDFVLWNASDKSIKGVAIRGEGAGGAFDSAAITSEAVYTHAFGTPGEYRWIDANGGSVSGSVRVQAADRLGQEDLRKWLETVKAGALITISGDKATPEQVEIVVGQTVFWAVEKASGISITDARLVTGGRPTSQK